MIKCAQLTLNRLVIGLQGNCMNLSLNAQIQVSDVFFRRF